MNFGGRFAALLVLALLVTGCGAVGGTPRGLPTAFDPCSLLDAAELHEFGFTTERSVSFTRDIDRVDGHSDWCHVTDRGSGPISVGVVFGEPFDDLDALMPSYVENVRHVDVGEHDALLGDYSFGGRGLAFQVGDTQLLMRNASDGGGTGLPNSEEALLSLAASIAAKVPSHLPDIERDGPLDCDSIDGLEPILGSVTYSRGRAADGRTSCHFVGTKHVLVSASYYAVGPAEVEEWRRSVGPHMLADIAEPLVAGTRSHGLRDDSNMVTSTLVGDSHIVNVSYKPICYDGCRSYGRIEPATQFTADDLALLASVVSLVRTDL